MPPTVTQADREMAVHVEGLGDDDLLIRSFTYSEVLGQLYRFSVAVTPNTAPVSVTDLVGKTVKLRVGFAAHEHRWLHGLIVRVNNPTRRDLQARYQLTVVPRAWLLSLHAQCRIYRASSVLDIVKLVFKEHGVAIQDKCKGTYKVRDFTVQYRESSLNFVLRLMEQYGIYFHFKHTDTEHAIVLCDDPASHQALEGHAEIDFLPPTGEMRPDRITKWEVDSAMHSSEVVLRDFDFKKFTTQLESIAVVPNDFATTVETNHDKTWVEDFPGEWTEETDAGKANAEGDLIAKVRSQELATAAVTYTGASTCRALSAGATFKLTDSTANLAAGFADKEFLLTGVTINGKADAYDRDTSGSGTRVEATLTAIPSNKVFRSRRITPKPVITGAQTATVVGPSGEEIHTDEFGRVKVYFHWDRLGKPQEGDTSCWIRVAQLWAGKQWGSMFIPRIGQEVIVEFLEGDPDQPLITGRVYNATNTVPYALPTNKTISSIRTNSSPKGDGCNEIRFEDKKDAEQLFIQAQKDFDLNILNDRNETVGHDRQLVVANDKLEHIKHDRHEHVVNDHFEAIDKDRHLKVKANENTEIGADQTLKVVGKVGQEIGGNHSLQITGDSYIKAENLVIEAGTNITIKVGGTTIAIEEGGISIKTSGDVKVEASGAIEGKATADVKLEATGNFSAKGTAGAKVEAMASLDLKGSAGAKLSSPAITEISGSLVKIN